MPAAMMVLMLRPPLSYLLVAFAACSGSPAVRGAPAPPAPQPAPTPPPAEFKIDNGMLSLPGPVEFVTGRSVPTVASDPALRHVVAFLAAKPAITLLRIEAHSDGSGEPAAQQTLTEGRALAVCLRLIELGASEARLLPVGFGNHKPLADGSTPAGRSQNGRIEFHPAEMNGRAIGGLPIDGGGRIAKPLAK